MSAAGGTCLSAARVNLQPLRMFPVRDQEGVHRAVCLQAGDGGGVCEGLAGLDRHEILAAVHNLGNDIPGAEVHVLQLRGKAKVHHLRSRNKKRIRGLCKADSGACPPKDKNYQCDFTCWVLAGVAAAKYQIGPVCLCGRDWILVFYLLGTC